MRVYPPLGLAAGLVTIAALGAAEDRPGLIPGYAVDTTVSAGYRAVDVDGSKNKYREDYNLQPGPQLYLFEATGRSTAPGHAPVDRFHLEVSTPGNEPVAHYQLSAANRTWFDLNANFTRSKYFYAVPELFSQPVPEDVRINDLHDFNLTRTNGSVDLAIHPPNLPTLLLGYRLYATTGDTITTLFVPSGDTFLVPGPVNSRAQVGRVGTEFRALGTDVFLQQEYRRVDRELTLENPLDPAGLDPTDASTMTSLHEKQKEHLDIPATTVRLRRPVGDALDLTGAYYYSHADLGFTGLEQRTATTDVPGVRGSGQGSNSGSATLDTHIADLGATYRVTDRVRLHATYRFNERWQNGDVNGVGALGPPDSRTGDQVRIDSLTGDVDVDPRDDLNLRAGVRWARRNANLSLSAQDVTTDTLGAIGSVRYRPWSFLDLFARYENVQVDDPLTVPGDPTNIPILPARQIVLTFTNRGTAGVRLTPWDWLALSYQLVADGSQNDSFDAHSRAFGNSVALTLSPLKDLTFFASYTRRDFDNRATILVAPLYQASASLQNGNENIFSTELRYDFALASQRWSTGWDVAYVTASNVLRPDLEPGGPPRTFYDLDRIDGGAFLTLHHWLVDPTFEFRMIDYNERVLPKNDYRATIISFKLTRRFSF